MRRVAILLCAVLVVGGLSPPALADDALDLRADPQAEVSVVVSGVRLFGVARVTGRVKPPHPGKHVTVTLLRAGEPVRIRHPQIRPDGTFVIGMPIRLPGWYRVLARFQDPDHRPGTATTKAHLTPLPGLVVGSRSVFVRLLEQRLVQLRYRLDGVDRAYDVRTGDAIVAFHKVQRMPRVFTVSKATWRALARPVVPRARFGKPTFHVEVDQTRQVVFTVRRGVVAKIGHVSTGKASTPTYDGTFRVYRKVQGTYNGLYYPSYFDGGRAMHGWKSVPVYAASHGCIRFPFWNARWIFGQTPIGTVVRIYH
jgi:hypothetical protein